MVGLLLLAGTALLLSSRGGGVAASSASESTVPRDQRIDPWGKRGMPPPSNPRSIGPNQVQDRRYDGKGGIPHPGSTELVGGFPRQAPAGAGVSVRPPASAPTMLPSRFRAPLPVVRVTREGE